MKSPRRPHPYQISDSVYQVDGDYVIETWWRIANARGDKEDAQARHGPFADAAGMAEQWRRA